MLPRRLELFPVLGTALCLHVSWLLLAPLIAVTLASIVFPALVPELSTVSYWGMAVAGTLGLFVSVFLRTVMEAFVCKLRGVPTQAVTLSVLGGAWQFRDRNVRATEEILLTASGLATSLAAAGVLLVMLFAGATAATPLVIAGVMFFLALINGGLAAVNLLPVYPLGTGRLLRAMLVRRIRAARATRIAGGVGALIGVAVAAAGAVALARDSLALGAWYLLVGTTVCWLALSACREGGDTRNPPAG